MRVLMKLCVLVFMVSLALNATAHEEHRHAKMDTAQKPIVVNNTLKASETAVQTPKPTGFPTLHPLVVHFPIVLFILAFIFQVIGLFNTQKNQDYITIAFLAGGIIGTYVAGYLFHPHTEGLSSAANEVLKRHELFADLTLWLGFAGLFVKSIAFSFLKKHKLFFEIITAVILLFSAVSVSVAGHWGATLTHIEGVGPQGKFLETE